MKPSENSAPPLIFLLPRYASDSAEHFYHLYGFLTKLQYRIPLQVIAERVSGVLPRDLPIRPLRGKSALRRFIEEILIFLEARLRGARLFYVHYSYSGAIAASLIARMVGGTVYYWNCGMYAGFSPPSGSSWRVWLQAARNRFLLETSVRMAHYLVTGTPRMKSYYAEHARIKESDIRVLPNFVDAGRFNQPSRKDCQEQLGLDPAKKVILFLHRVAQRKGAHYLIRIAQSLVKDVPDAQFVVAGDGPLLKSLMHQVRQEGLESRFDFRGWVPNRDAPLFFRACDLFLMPSEEEGFPRVLLEAMAAECPFVAFDVGGVRDIVPTATQDCVVPAGNLDEFIARCRIVLTDAAARRRWVAAGRRQAHIFSEERVLEDFVSMIRGEPVRWERYRPVEEEMSP